MKKRTAIKKRVGNVVYGKFATEPDAMEIAMQLQQQYGEEGKEALRQLVEAYKQAAAKKEEE